MSRDLVVTPNVTLPAADLDWTAVRAGGPGGQNVNKVSTKVELRFDLPGTSALSDAAKARLRSAAASRLDAEGCVIVTADETRSQARNLELAREKLAELVKKALVAPKRRRATKPSAQAKRRRVEAKRKTGQKKQARNASGWD